MKYSDDDIKRLIARNRLKLLRDKAEELAEKPVIKTEVVRYGYDRAEAMAQKKIHDEMVRHTKVVMAKAEAMKLGKRKKGYGGIGNKALVPKRGEKAGPLED